ncbi:hypothetical protein [Geodermatophilus sp. URMC 63]
MSTPAGVPFSPPVRTGVPVEEFDDVPVGLGPVWAGPPWHVRPGIAPLSLEIGRSDSTVVLLEGARARPDGVVVRLVVAVRETGREARRRVFTELDVTHGRGRLDLCLPPGGLRRGVQYADGRRVTTLDDPPSEALPDGADPGSWTPDGPVLEGVGRPVSWGGTWSRDVWPWPLPPPGPVRVVCSWPDRGVAEAGTTTDSAPLRAATSAAVPLWPAPDGA